MAQILSYECEKCESIVEFQDNDMTEYNENKVCKKCWELVYGYSIFDTKY